MGLISSEKASALPPPAAPQIPANMSSQPAVVVEAPDEPLVTIEATTSWSALSLRELWAYRELLYFLTWRELKIRYKQTALGVAWIVMQPLLTMLIFTVVLGLLVKVPFEGPAYPLFVFAGLTPWTFFSSAVVGSGISLVSNSNLITKVYFPRVIIPMSAVAARLVDLLMVFVILAGLMIYYRAPITPQILFLPLLVGLTTVLALGFGMLIAAINVRYRDAGVALPVLIQLGMFISPVIYPSSLVPPNWRLLYSLNPMVGILDGFRAALLGTPFNWTALLISATIAVVLLSISIYIFQRVQKGFADVI